MEARRAEKIDHAVNAALGRWPGYRFDTEPEPPVTADVVRPAPRRKQTHVIDSAHVTLPMAHRVVFKPGIVRPILPFYAWLEEHWLWGYRNYETREGSRNNVVTALLSHGEWHNNHHADPGSAMHGHRAWEIDPVFWVVRLLAALGLARDIVMPSVTLRGSPDPAAAGRQR